MPQWAEAWSRYQIGVSLLAEKGVGRRQKGAVSLIYLPADEATSDAPSPARTGGRPPKAGGAAAGKTDGEVIPFDSFKKKKKN